MIHIYTDGGANLTGHMAWAAMRADTDIRTSSWWYGTNQDAEIHGIIAGLTLTPQGSRVTIHTDSKFAIGVCSGRFKNILPKFQDLMAIYYQEVLTMNLIVYYQLVKGHAGIPENEWCDHECQRLLRLARSG